MNDIHSQLESIAKGVGLRPLLAEYPETAAGILLHTGSKIKRMGEKIIAMPWMLLSGFQ